MATANLPTKTLSELKVEIKFHLGQMAGHAVEIGNCLIQAKEQVEHGEWQHWLEENFSLKRQSAQNFMKIAERFGANYHLNGNFNQTQLVEMLALPAGEEENFIAEKAAEGTPVEDMTVKNLREEIKNYKSKLEEMTQERDGYKTANEIADQQLENLGDEVEMLRQGREDDGRRLGEMAEENLNLQADKADLQEKVDDLQNELLRKETVTVEVAPADYETTKTELSETKATVERLQAELNMDLRKFNKLEDIPAELFQLDILDGSPPCTPFSTMGQREKTWGKKKKFAEGQTEQVLDDLFFVFLETAEKLQPKIIIAENVIGLVKGNAKGYVNQILKKFYALGYEVQVFKLNSAFMNVPQVRERIFFIANNQRYPKLKLNFDFPLIKFGEVRTEKGKPIDENSLTAKRLKHLRPTDHHIGYITERIEGKRTNFNHMINFDDKVCFTLTANGNHYRAYDKSRLSDGDYINASTFPQDYDFCNQNVQFVCGMCVPPNMMANIATEIYKQWLVK